MLRCGLEPGAGVDWWPPGLHLAYPYRRRARRAPTALAHWREVIREAHPLRAGPVRPRPPVTAEGSQPDPEVAVGAAPWRWVGLLLGPAVFAAVLLFPEPAGLAPVAWRTTAVALFMVVWWVTEAIPIPATALLPLVLFPALGIATIEGAAAPYANPVMFLFLGGFMIAQAMQRWRLHRRLALMVILQVGTRPGPLIAGFMAAAAFLSMWVSNTATAVMMLPIALSVVERAQTASSADGVPAASSNFAVALLLGLTYSCSIGGLGTLIGSPPNALLAGFVADRYSIEIGFGAWMMLGIPLVAVGLPLTWLLLTRWLYPVVDVPALAGGREPIRAELQAMGRPARGEKVVAAVFAVTAAAWIVRPLLGTWIPGLSDAGIAIAAAVLLFVIPVDARRGVFALNWEWAARLPWHVLLLFGGGLSLAAAISQSGLAEWIGQRLAGLDALPIQMVVVLVSLVIIFLTELASNTAIAAAFVPIAASLAVGMGQSPLVLAVPAALAASCAFMLPVATPPNAVVYGSGHLTIPQMARAGLALNLLFVALLSTLGYVLVGALFGA